MSNDGDGLSRRSVLATSATGAIGGLIAAGTSEAEAADAAKQPDVYAQLGIKKVINAAGTITTMGGS